MMICNRYTFILNISFYRKYVFYSKSTISVKINQVYKKIIGHDLLSFNMPYLEIQ